MNIKTISIFVNEMAIVWDDQSTGYIGLKKLRDACPCAFCSGEKDVFGNIYKGEKPQLKDKAFTISNYSFIGLYGLKITWGDLHSDGIYTIDLIKKLCSLNEQK